ncbi:MAG: hypothetical protein ACOCXP_03170 [Candidatus Dojkabacteria bacterium]
MGHLFTKKFKLNNPFKPDEQITQEVQVNTTPQIDYSQVEWVAIDTEFIDLRMAYSQLCVVQIASPSAEQDRQNIEVIWVWESQHSMLSEIQEKLSSIFEREDIQILMHFAGADLPRIEKLVGKRVSGQVFDTKTAARIIMSNTDRHGLKDLITGLIDPKYQKDKQVTASNWDLNPITWEDKMVDYAMRDVLYLKPIEQILIDLAKRRGSLELVNEIMRTIPAISQLHKHDLEAKVLDH